MASEAQLVEAYFSSRTTTEIIRDLSMRYDKRLYAAWHALKRAGKLPKENRNQVRANNMDLDGSHKYDGRPSTHDGGNDALLTCRLRQMYGNHCDLLLARLHEVFETPRYDLVVLKR